MTSECSVNKTLANSADPGQMLQKEACGQGLHCMLKLQEVKDLFRTIFQAYTQETIDSVVSALIFQPKVCLC